MALNAGAALYVAGAVPDIATGYRRAGEALAGGAAAAKLEQVIGAVHALLEQPESPPAGSAVEGADRPRAAAGPDANGAAARAVATRPRPS